MYYIGLLLSFPHLDRNINDLVGNTRSSVCYLDHSVRVSCWLEGGRQPVGSLRQQQAASEGWTSPSGAWAIKCVSVGHSVPHDSSKSVSNKGTVCLNFPVFCQSFDAANQPNIQISKSLGCRTDALRVQIVASKLHLVTYDTMLLCTIRHAAFENFLFEENCSFYYCPIIIYQLESFNTAYHFPEEMLVSSSLWYMQFWFNFFNKLIQGKMCLASQGSMDYLKVSLDISLLFLHQCLFVLPFLQWKLLQIKLSDRETWLLGSQARWHMLPGRKERWVPDYRRKPFFILLESKSSLYTDDKFTNSPGVRFQREIRNFNMFPKGEVNLMTFPQDGGEGCMHTYILFCGGKSF